MCVLGESGGKVYGEEEGVLIDVGRRREMARLNVPPLELSVRVETKELGREERGRLEPASSGRSEDEEGVSRGVMSTSPLPMDRPRADVDGSSSVDFRRLPRARLAILLNDAAADRPRLDSRPR